MGPNVRASAARVLGQVLNGRSLNQVLPPAVAQLPEDNRALLQQLCYGSLRRAPELQALLAQLLDKPLKPKDRDVEGLLLLGLYQLEDTRIPDHAAVAETVSAAVKLKKPWAKGLCNALLRRFLRERETLKAALNESAASAHPDWLYRELAQHWPDDLAQILDANNRQPPMTLRVNQLLGNREEYLRQLSAANIPARPGALCPQAIYLESPLDVNKLPGFGRGSVSVQDEAAQLAAALVAAASGDKVLDACAAPGGKSCHILETQPALGQLIAADADTDRLLKVEQNLERLRLRASCVTADASAPTELTGLAPFDRILVDAPCSATGVIRRHPDIKLLRRAEDIASLAALQLSILRGLWPLLRSGGRLVYATCSVLPQENDSVISAFCQQQADAQLCEIEADWGRATTCGRQLLPQTGGPDGLYYAILVKG